MDSPLYIVFSSAYGFSYYVVSSDMFYPLFLQFSWEIASLLYNLIGESRYRRAATCL